MPAKRPSGKARTRKATVNADEAATRWPDEEEQRRIAAELGLRTPEQSNNLWRPISELVIDYRRFRKTIPPAGDDRLALHERIRDLSKVLTKAERLLQRRTSFLDHRLGRLLGPQLGALLNDDAMRQLSGTYQAPYISIHDHAYLEADGDSDGPDRISVARYHEAVNRRQLLARTQTAEEEACPILRTYITTLNEPLKAYLQTVQRNRGGTPGRIFRNEAIRRLAVIYEKMFGKPATPTAGGPFLNFCRVVLEAIDIETDGLRSAAVRELKKLKT